DLALESRPGKGARFVLSLPAAAALPVASPAPPAPPAPSAVRPGAVPHPVASLAGLHVLIVDDEEAVRRPMARFLSRRGARVDEAQDGGGALEGVNGAGGGGGVSVADVRVRRVGGVG